MRWAKVRWVKVAAVCVAAAVAVSALMYARATIAATATPTGIALMDPMPYMKAVGEATATIAGLDYVAAEGVHYQGTRIVRVPGKNFGGVAVQLDDTGKVISLMEIKNTVNGGIVTSDTFVNGKQIASIQLDEKSGQILAGWVMRGEEKVPVTDDVRANVNWRCWTNCMSNIMGVPNWVIGIITAICGLACIGTAGAGCVLCAQGAVIAYGAEAAFCFGYCG